MSQRRLCAIWAVLLILMALACRVQSPATEVGQDIESTRGTSPTNLPPSDGDPTAPLKPTPPQPTELPASPGDKWSLWTNGTQLRGANIYQRLVVVEMDGSEFVGSGRVGPPYTQEDLNNLAALGANYVNISHAGLFTERPPYELDEAVQANLDNLLDMIAQADMFAVISFRTGPGRSEWSVCCGNAVGDWLNESYLNDEVWRDREAQDAWVEMWRHTAERYRQNPIVAGYDLMVEPNANDVWLDEWDPEVFTEAYGGSLYDWNQLHPRISAAIRQVDPNTPILTGGMSYSGIEWLPFIESTSDGRTVYTAHQYEPHVYTHQWWDDIQFGYPGFFDTDWDGVDDRFDRDWLDELFWTVDDFMEEVGAPVAINEYGMMRWVPNAVEFLDDEMALFEQWGINYAIWVWEVSYPPFAEEVHHFNFRYGVDPQNIQDDLSNDLIKILRSYWELNTVRPSNFIESL